MLARSKVVSYCLLIVECCMLVMIGAMWLIVFLLYFPTIDANDSGEEEEVVRTRILFILTGFLYWWSWRSPGTNKPRQAISWSLNIESHIVVTLLLLLSLDLSRVISTFVVGACLPWACLLSLAPRRQTPFVWMVVVNIMIMVYPLNVMGMPTYLECVDLLTPFLHPLVVWWLVSCPCYTFYLVMLCILTPKCAEPLVDAIHTYSQVCWTSCWCYAYLLSSMLNPLLLLCMLTLSMYMPPWPPILPSS